MGAQGRDIASTARLALDASGRTLALDVKMVANLGAYLSGNGPGASVVAASTAQGGVYDIPAIAVDVRGALTNTVPVDAYRGAGKPEANYIIERAIEAAARKLGRDPAELRRQNLIASFPHRTALGMAIDSGDFVGNLEATRYFKRPVEIVSSVVVGDRGGPELIEFTIKGNFQMAGIDPPAPPPTKGKKGKGGKVG